MTYILLCIRSMCVIEEQLFAEDLRMIELEIPGLDVALFGLSYLCRLRF